MSHTIPAPPCIRGRHQRLPVTARLIAAAATTDRIAAAVEAEIERLGLIGEDTGDLSAIARDLGALHGELDELEHQLAAVSR